jgi:DNA mismatch repair protein MutL
LGFRGEALASIASVSDVSLTTYTGETFPIRAYVKNGSTIIEPAQGRTKGTTITVDNIFNNVPARRKFLRSPTTEYKYIIDTFTYMALSHPKISFKLYKDQKLITSLPMAGSSSERISLLFPNIKATELIPLEYSSPKLNISGNIGHPSTSRQDHTQQYIFVNGRYVRDALINKAVREGYASTLMNNQQPSFFVFIDIDPTTIDVNIHPRKLEVKFGEPSAIFMAIKIAVEKTLAKYLQNDLKNKTSGVVDWPKTQYISSQNAIHTHNPSSHTQTALDGLEFTKSLLQPINSVPAPWDEQPKSSMINPSQFFNTYIVFEKEDRLLFVDQHAADERVNYEKILKSDNLQLLHKVDLLIPITLHLTMSEIELCHTYSKEIRNYGFDYKINELMLTVTAVPTLLQNKFSDTAFRELLNDFEESAGATGNRVLAQKEHIAATLSCHSSIRAGQLLNRLEMEHLITNLFNCTLPYSCPHGRPIIWELSKNELEKNFKRKI